ncbi:C40 family peptidase [Sporosarcina sp. SAFN-010]|uniref:C40 family peptidase n=1 Tax=Sporosarcina sp. SAFN-010 TaxID=3387273 RepID=UPI003F8110CB
MKKILTLLMALGLLLMLVPSSLGKEAHASMRVDVPNFALKFKGAPYLWGGTTPAGFDCSGYILHVYTHFNMSLPRTSEDQFKVGTPVALDDLQPGDLVFFKDTYKPGISHTGIYLGNNQFISAASSGVTVDKLTGHSYWGPRYAGAKRVLPFKQFTDLSESHLAYEAVQDLTEKAIISGFQDDSFRPDLSITRGQAAAMLNRVLKLKATNVGKFTDVPANHQFAVHVAAMNQAGILKGYDATTYGFNDELTRGQLAVIMDRAFKLTEKAGNNVHTASLYKDVPATHWMSKSILALKVVDRTKVFQTATYDVVKPTTRAEFSAAVYSAIN